MLSSSSYYLTDVDLDSYLESVENNVRSRGPVLEVAVTETHRNTMIRTLLGIENKIEFDIRPFETEETTS